jgi:hypothetical protein
MINTLNSRSARTSPQSLFDRDIALDLSRFHISQSRTFCNRHAIAGQVKD